MKYRCRAWLIACLATLSAGLTATAHATSNAPLLATAARYEHGEGVPQDLKHAAQLYCEAAKEGDPEAQYRLGWMYFNGRGVERNDLFAAKLLSMAAEQGHQYAGVALRFTDTRERASPACMLTAEQGVPELMEPSLDEEFEVSRPARQKIVKIVQELAPQYGIDPRLALYVIRAESGFNTEARSPKNAQGLMQLIPDTARRFNVKSIMDPKENIKGGLAYLQWLLTRFQGNLSHVLAAYNAGEGSVDKYKGVPPFNETRQYVQRILGWYGKQEHPYREAGLAGLAVKGDAKP